MRPDHARFTAATHLALPDLVHIPLCNILSITVFAEVLQLFLCPGYPEGVGVKDLKAGCESVSRQYWDALLLCCPLLLTL